MTSPTRWQSNDDLSKCGLARASKFRANGVTAPVTLMGDDTGLTQLAGEPPVAWQTPWEEIADLRLVRVVRGLALLATIDGIRYCWRTSDRRDEQLVGEVVAQHGGLIHRRGRRVGVFAVVVVVLLASLSGVIAASLSSGSSTNQQVKSTISVNLSLKDLPSGWFQTPKNSTILSYLFPSPGVVQRPSPTPAKPAAKNSAFAELSSLFQHCLGVSAKKDRMYGAAGQNPLYQVSSNVFGTQSDGGVEAASLTQYYATTTMVNKDTAEMRDAGFGACLAQSQAAIVQYVYTKSVAHTPTGTNWQPDTFVHGFSRAGVVAIKVAGVAGSLYLVIVQLTANHYKTTLGALVTSWPKEESVVANLANTLLSRMTSPTSAAV